MKLLEDNLFIVIGLVIAILVISFSHTTTNPKQAQIPSGIKVAYAVENLNKDFSHVSGDIYIYSVDLKTTSKIYHYDFKAQNPPELSQQTNSYSIIPADNQSLILRFNLSGEVFTKLIGLDGTELTDKNLEQVLKLANDFILLNEHKTLVAHPETDFNDSPAGQNPIILHNLITGKQRKYSLPNAKAEYFPWKFSHDDKYLFIQESGSSNHIDILDLATGKITPVVSSISTNDISNPTPAENVAIVREGEYTQIDPATQSDFPKIAELYLIDLIRDKSTLISSIINGNYTVIGISPDSKKLLFSQADESNPNFNSTYLLDTSNPTMPEKIFNFFTTTTSQSWSKDGKTVLLKPNPDQYTKNSFLYNIETKKITQIPRTRHNPRTAPTNIIGLFE